MPRNHTAVLFGDFLQLGPVLDGEKGDPSQPSRSGSGPPASRTWASDAPSDIESDGSCVALTHQFRFGPELRRLANDVIYEVLRDAADLPRSPSPQTEIVLVDVSTVPDLAAIRAGSVAASGGRPGSCCPGRWPSCTSRTGRSGS